MIRFWCECGRQLQAREADIGRLASCPLCGQTATVPESDQLRREDRSRQEIQPLPASPAAPAPVQPIRLPLGPQATSGLATTSLALGLLSFPFFLAVITSIPAIVTGILALRRIARSQGQLGGKGNAIAGLALGCLGLLAAPSLYLAVRSVRVNAARMRDGRHLKQMAFAFHNYHNTNGFFPAATSYYTRDGKPGLSWRVALLPYIEEDNLFKQFRLDEPWDSPHNKKLLPRMPKMYLLPGREDEGSGLTHYQLFVGPDTPFGLRGRPRHKVPGIDAFIEEGPRIPMSFPAGTSGTILIVTARDPVPWTKPDDLPHDRNKPLPPLGGHFGAGFNAALADGSVRWIESTMRETILRRAITSQAQAGPDW
jgi:hypothetical protein